MKQKNHKKNQLSTALLLSMVAFACVLFALPINFNVISVAQAAVVTPNTWVQVLTKPDPMMQDLSIPADAVTKGMWSPVVDWPMNGVHINVLPDGRVLTFGGPIQGDAQDGRTIDIWDPTLGFADDSHTTTFRVSQPNSFCSASVYLNDGSILIAGGKDEGTATALLNPTTNAMTLPPNIMTQPRWYSTMLKLPDGRAVIMGGMYQDTEPAMANDPDAALNLASETPEIYEFNASTGEYEWRSLLGVRGNGSTIADNSRLAFGPDYLRTSYPRAWVAPNGFIFGISTDRMWYLDVDGNNGNGEIIDAGQFKPPYSQSDPVNVGPVSTAVMYAPGKILQVGGNGGHAADGLPASNMATKIDINGLAPVISEEPLMTYPRRFASSIVLANGEVVVTGGTGKGNDLYETNNQGEIINDFTVLTPEIWTEGVNGAPGSWRLGANAANPRFYHSITALLPNGTILSTGGGTPGPVLNKNAEVYYPPYLFESVNGTTQLASRPVIDAISGLSHAHNAAMQLDMASTDAVSDLVLIRLSNATHAFNPGQRRIPLTFTQLGNRLTTATPGANIAPPGYYQLVALNANGVPSLGAVIAIGQDLVPPNVPTEPYTPAEVTDLIEAPIINAGGQASFTVTAQEGLTYSWNFGDGTPDTPFSENPDSAHVYAQAGVYMVTLRAKDADDLISFRTFLQAVATDKTALQPTSSSAIALETVAGGAERIWVVNPDNDSVSVIDATSKVLVSTIDVEASPRNIAIAPDGKIWVSNKKSATISIISPTTLSVVQTVALPRASQPHGLIFSPDGNSAFVVLEATGQLLKLNPTTGAQISSVDVGLHARHVAASADLSTVLVSRFITPPLPGESTALVDVTPTNGAEVVVVNPATMVLVKTTILQHSNKTDAEAQGSGIPNYLASPVISPDGTTAWVPSKQDNIKRGVFRNQSNPDLNLNFQNTVRAISSNINMTTLNEDYAKRVDFDNASVASAALYHPSGAYLFVALETSREVAVINAITGFELFRIDVGRAPQGLSLSNDGNTLFVQEFMDRSVSVYDLTPLTQQGLLKANFSNIIFTVATEKLPAEVVIGKQLFYDAKDPRLAKDSYMSCASCHNDGGHDGRVWDLTGFGEGLRNTIDLRGRAGMGHGFLHWSANFDEVQDFEKQIRDLAGGTGLMADAEFNAGTRNQPLGDPKAGVSPALDSLAAYVASLDTFAKNPNRNPDSTLTNNAQLGNTLFNNQCILCHSGVKLTNSLNASTLQNIGTIKPSSGQRLNSTLTGIDVPTLRGVWATGPYLHDGSASNLTAAIQAHSNNSLNLNEPSEANYISPADVANIVEYLSQLGSDKEEDPAQVGAWHFNENAGNTAADDSGYDQTLQLSNVGWTGGKAGSAGLFNGSNAKGTPSAPALINTVESFTVAAWVKLDTLNGWRTIINQDGENVSGFWLQYSQQLGGKFIFSMYEEDTLSSPVYRATSTTQPEVGEWYHLVGVRNVETGQMQLYVNGVLEAETANPTSWSATGDFNVGRGKWGNPNDWFAGAIDEVNVYNYPISQSEITALYQENNTGNAQPIVSVNPPTTSSLVNTPVTLTATATDSDGTVTSVEFFSTAAAVETSLGTATLTPDTNNYTLSWTPTLAGNYAISAKATDNEGTLTNSAPVTFTVDPVLNNVAPTVALTSPLEGSSTLAGVAITLSATASDTDGTISSVAFYDGATLIGNGTLAAGVYGFEWTTASVGNHVITAQATDDDNAVTTSVPVNIVVTAVVTTEPVVTVTAPAAATEVNTPITLIASASNIEGVVTSVEFFSTAAGVATSLGVGTLVPETNTYSLSWTPTVAGTYAISATVTNDAEVAVNSTPVNFTVEPINTTPSIQVGSWSFNEGAGAIAADSAGNDQPLALNNVAWTTGKVGAFAGQFNGTNASGTPSAPALINTAESFTVAAWIKLDTLNGWRTIINQDAENVSGFWLQYSQQLGGKFIFSMYEADTLSSPVYRAISTTQPEVGEWYHLVGVRNVETGQMQLYVNGVLEAETANPTSWSATGDFNVGRGKWGNPNDWFAGAIDEVNVYNYPITTAEVVGLYEQVDVANVAPAVSLTSPLEGSSTVAGTAITLSAIASDTDGTISSVSFYDGATLIGNGTLTAGVYGFEWTTASVGNHVITAQAKDDDNAVTTSVPVNIVVTAVVTTEPVVTVTAPAAATEVNTPVTLIASASNIEGVVTSVEFFSTAAGVATSLGVGTLVPETNTYSLSWTPTIAGTYAISATVTNNAEVAVNSTPVNFTVEPESTLPNALPVVSVTEPTASSLVNTPVTLAATATDSDGTVTSVEFFSTAAAVETSLGTATLTPETNTYTLSWTPTIAGTYVISAKATDNEGALTNSAPVTFTVDPVLSNVAPTVALTSPLEGSSTLAGVAITLSAIASDTDGTISSVAFYDGTTLIGNGTLTAGVYGFEWTTASVGNHVITAQATDDDNAVTISAPVNIVVTPVENELPLVAVTAPATSTLVNTPVTLNATATDSDGAIASVTFFSVASGIESPLGAGVLITGTNTYDLAWTPSLAGTYMIIAKATDDAGAVVTSTAVALTVDPVVTVPNVLPDVSVVAPVASTPVNTPVTVLANATDSDGNIAGVEFFSTAGVVETSLGAATLVPESNTYTLSWTPTLAGVYAISAKATDDLGAVTTSTVVSFTVDPEGIEPKAQLGVWNFNEGAGEIASDNSNNGQPLQLNNVTWTTGKVGTAGQFNGSDAAGSPSAPALIDTTASFTVAAWVKLDTLNGWRTIMNQDGENVSGFWLQYSQQLGGIFTFTMRETDELSGPVHRTRSTTKPVIGEWYHLVGVKDVETGRMELYVNGVLEATDQIDVTWAATGDFNVGRGKWDSPNDWFAGAIDEVNVYNYPITATEVDGLYQQGLANVAPVVTVTAPINNASYTVGAPITLTATAIDNDGSVAAVEFFSTVDSVTTSLGVAADIGNQQYSLNWTPTIVGATIITAKATDNEAAVSDSNVINLVVVDTVVGNTAPTVSLAAPVNNASYETGAVVSLVANAADVDNNLTSVVFYDGTTLLATVTEAPYTFDWIAVGEGSHFLIAQAIDDAGAVTTSAAVNVEVTSPIVATQLGVWNFNEGAGEIASDNSNNGQPLQLNNVTWTTGKVGTAGQFNGSDAAGSPSAPALIDTTASFTVAAWVKLDTLNGWRTIMNQDGENVSGFWLQYSQQLGGIFTFTMRETDELSGPVHRTRSTTKPVIGEWYHLVGVKDVETGRMELYVNGVLEATDQIDVTWAATGDFNVGRGKWDSPNDWFAGAIDEVNVYNYPITATEVDGLYQAGAGE